MKQIEMIIRVNVSIPDSCNRFTDCCISFPIAQTKILDNGLNPISNAKVNEYETIDVYEAEKG